MKKIVVDAGVAIKWFVPEIHCEAAVRLLDPSVILLAPDLIGPEFGNILWKKVRRGEIAPAEANEILGAFEVLPLEVRASSLLLVATFELAAELERSFYDCLYLALAIAEECRMVTADAKFHAVLQASRLAGYVMWVED